MDHVPPRLRRLIQLVAPPFVVDLYRRVRYPPTWSGTYPRITDVPAGDPALRGRGWRRSAIDPRDYDTLPREVLHEHDFLAVLAASLARQNNGALKVLDFGGGLGIGYAHLLRTLGGGLAVEYHVVDLDWACEEGRRIFETDRRISFHPSLPDQLPGLDILHANSSLQYVEDYAGVLGSLCRHEARYLLFVDVHAGDFRTYATAQLNVPGTALPVWFINRDEFVALVRRGGYDLVLETLTPDCVPQNNFPEALRLPQGRRRVMLFARSRRAEPPGSRR